jgi:endonuclease YncB( thermonuclease family)
VRLMILAAATMVALVVTHLTDAAEITGRVVSITDGDTLIVLTNRQRQEKIRLSDIDAPESGQPYGARSRQALADLAFQQSVRVIVRDTDRYGRPVGRIYTGPVDVNEEMVRRGVAWVYWQYNRDPTLLAVESEARAAKRGLWALPEAEQIPPWEWRQMAHATRHNAIQHHLQPTVSTTASPSRPGASAGFTCGAKSICREMTSCAEARFYLTQCGVTRLDSDRDGIPCKSICNR